MDAPYSFQDPYTASLTYKVYRDTWNGFYVWEQDHCLRTLHSLARNLSQETSQAGPSTSNRGTEQNNSVLDPVYSLAPEEALSPNAEEESFTVIDYNAASEAQVVTLPVKVIGIAPLFEPYAPYELCTPANRNINVGDDSEYMPFIPLVDDPNFDHLLHAGDYRYFEWQLPDRDPDLDVILTRTLHKLHHDHRLSFEAIDQTKLLRLPLSRIFHIGRRRDFPEWPELTTRLPYLPSHAGDNPFLSLSNLASDFCNNMNCLIGYCTVHLGEMRMPEAITSTKHTNTLAHSVEAPCGPECFLLGKMPANCIGTIWTTNDVETLTTILSFSPDLSPCDLATICRKPCHEVFKQRGHIIPDAAPVKQTDKVTKRPIRSATLQYQDHDAASFTPNWPCSHPGPCDARADCACYANDAHCERSCRCDKKCFRRWRGCSCAKSKNQNTCGTSRCPCYRAHRECDPEVCIRCEARDAASDICKSSSIQRCDRKRTEVRQSTHGLGLYLCEEVKEEDFIIEYTGELVFEITTICRDFVSKHRGRSYLFQLNPTTSIDSSKAGNESRFINHDPENANCHACVRLVNGEHRIGIFALCRLKPGTELLLNYGDSFFQPDSEGSKGESKLDPKRPGASQDSVAYNLDQHSSDETYNE